MFCRNCGTQLNDGDAFCPNCGTPNLVQEISETGRTTQRESTPVTAQAQRDVNHAYTSYHTPNGSSVKKKKHPVLPCAIFIVLVGVMIALANNRAKISELTIPDSNSDNITSDSLPGNSDNTLVANKDELNDHNSNHTISTETDSSDFTEQEIIEKEPTKLAATDNKESGADICPITMDSVSSIQASSYLIEKNHIHAPENIADGTLSNAWAEGSLGQGIGDWIQFSFYDIYSVSGIEIYSGYQKSDDLYKKNSRPKDIRIVFSDGTQELFILDDTAGGQTIHFSIAKNINTLTLYIESVYAGTSYEDTVISEINLF